MNGTTANLTAVLLRAGSVQKYVFRGNKLKLSLGASSLITDIFEGILKRALSKSGLEYSHDWRNKSDDIKINHNMLCKFEVGYIGGGNALLLFRERTTAIELIKSWTTDLLLCAPGLKTSVAILEDFDLNGKFKEHMSKLVDNLDFNANSEPASTELPRHGITAICPFTGLSAEVEEPKLEGKYVSSSAASKASYIKINHEKYNEFSLTNELDKLGQKLGDSHIAIVHIDGNDMGSKFSAPKSLIEMRRLSIDVSNAVNGAFESLCKRISDEYDKIREELKLEDKIFPLRLIIKGGDDITFVCDGRFGIYFAKIFMEAFQTYSISKNEYLSSCAGVVVTRTKFPFYRGYVLAEELCSSAKAARREKNSSGSWLDYHVVSSEALDSIQELRERHFQSESGKLYMRPYCIENGILVDSGFGKLLINAKALSKFPRNRIMELRRVLPLGEDIRIEYVQKLKLRGIQLPNSNYSEKLFLNMETPYMDMIELLDMYPKYGLSELLNE